MHPVVIPGQSNYALKLGAMCDRAIGNNEFSEITDNSHLNADLPV